jgi:hypothetical protein
MTKLVKATALLIGILSICSLALYTYLTPARPFTIIVPELKLTLKRNVSLDSTNLSFWAGVAALEPMDRNSGPIRFYELLRPECLPVCQADGNTHPAFAYG